MNIAAPETEASSRPVDADAAPRHLRLRALSREVAQAETTLARRFAPVSVDVGGGRIGAVIDTAPGQARPSLAGEVLLSLTIDGHPAALALDWGLARRLAGEPLEGADPQDAALLLEEGMADWLDAGEAAAGLGVRFTALGSNEEAAGWLRRALLVQGKAPRGNLVRQRVPLALSPGAATALASRLVVASTPEPPESLLLRVSLEREARRLTAEEIRSLRPGDAVTLGPDAGARLVVEGTLAASATPLPQGVRLDGPLRPIAKEDTPMQDAPETGEGGPDAATVDSIELRVAFRAGERLMTVAELKALAPGAIVDLAAPPDAEVEIVVNGRVIGRGELIEVAGRRAVQVRSLA